MSIRQGMLIALAGTIAACGSDMKGPPVIMPPPSVGDPSEPFVHVAPQLLVASPSTMAVGRV